MQPPPSIQRAGHTRLQQPVCGHHSPLAGHDHDIDDSRCTPLPAQHRRCSQLHLPREPGASDRRQHNRCMTASVARPNTTAYGRQPQRAAPHHLHHQPAARRSAALQPASAPPAAGGGGCPPPPSPPMLPPRCRTHDLLQCPAAAASSHPPSPEPPSIPSPVPTPRQCLYSFSAYVGKQSANVALGCLLSWWSTSCALACVDRNAVCKQEAGEPVGQLGRQNGRITAAAPARDAQLPDAPCRCCTASSMRPCPCAQPCPWRHRRLQESARNEMCATLHTVCAVATEPRRVHCRQHAPDRSDSAFFMASARARAILLALALQTRSAPHVEKARRLEGLPGAGDGRAATTRRRTPCPSWLAVCVSNRCTARFAVARGDLAHFPLAPGRAIARLSRATRAAIHAAGSRGRRPTRVLQDVCRGVVNAAQDEARSRGVFDEAQ